MEIKIRVLIAEDHAVVRGAVTALLDSEPDIEVIGEAADGEQAVLMAKQLKPDIVLMDIGMPNLNGAQATRRVKNQTPDTKVLVLTRHDDSGYLKKLLEEGADGYVLKQGASSVLIGAVRQVAAGNGFLDPAMAVGMVSQIAKRHPVSGEDIIEVLGERETSVLRLTALGYSVKEIATRLEIGPKTVENARSAVTRKLGLSSRVEIVQYAVRQGWMKDD